MAQLDDLRDECNASLWSFARYMLPHYMFGDMHKEIMDNLGADRASQEVQNKLVMVSRDHLKSVVAAVYTVWKVSRNPAYTMLYMVADEGLGRLQMSFMQGIIESPRYRMMYPEHFDPDKGRRAKWTGLAVTSDHPDREAANVRDETIFVATARQGTTGRHPHEIVFDDIVVPENAYTQLGRDTVKAIVSQTASLVRNDGYMTAVGTRYHVQDQYDLWINSTLEHYDESGNLSHETPFWELIEHAVETNGDGTGRYSWPRTAAPDGQWYGWNPSTLAKKRAEYRLNGQMAQFYAQYYLNPNDISSNRLEDGMIQYADPRNLRNDDGVWKYAGRKLNILAAMDTAQTDASSATAARADFTAIAIIGRCGKGFYYVLELQEFQTDKRSVYFDELKKMFRTWQFRDLYIETAAAGKIIALALQDDLRETGLPVVVNGVNAPSDMAKHERHAGITVPKYRAKSVMHFRGGLTSRYEEQLTLERPPFDDLLDAVTIGFEHIKKPYDSGMDQLDRSSIIMAASRFGGRRRK